MSDSVPPLPARPSLEQLRKQAKELLRDYRAGQTDAVRRFRAAGCESATLANAQFTVAREYGFPNWSKLKQFIDASKNDRLTPDLSAGNASHLYRINRTTNTLEVGSVVSDKDWDFVFAAIEEHGITGLNAGGRITDAALGRVGKLDHVTRLNLEGSAQLTDEGLAHLAQLPSLQELDISGSNGRITDEGLAVLRQLPQLTNFKMCWQPNVSDAGIANLAGCTKLESVDLMGTSSGDGAIRALTGKPALRRLKTGRKVTDAALPLLGEFPRFKTWHGGDIRYGLMQAEAGPTFLMLDGPLTSAGVTALAGLDGLFGLSFFWHSPFTAAWLKPVADLLNLGFLGCPGERCDNDAMRFIAGLPRLRMLMAQGAVADDAGFSALSGSRSIQYIWGRECPNLTGRGFAAMAAMPALRGLAVSCKNVDDAALALLPRFPALREFMPMDVPDEGFRHVGACKRLKKLWCMYCRDTGDRATEHIAGLELKSYYAGSTRITDRSLEILGHMHSLERLQLWRCPAITNRGVQYIAGLPRLREISLEGLAGVTLEAASCFPERVSVSYSG